MSAMFRFDMPLGYKARIARNSQLLRRFVTQKLNIADIIYEFMNKSGAPLHYQRRNEYAITTQQNLAAHQPPLFSIDCRDIVAAS